MPEDNSQHNQKDKDNVKDSDSLPLKKPDRINETPPAALEKTSPADFTENSERITTFVVPPKDKSSSSRGG